MPENVTILGIFWLFDLKLAGCCHPDGLHSPLWATSRSSWKSALEEAFGPPKLT